MPGLPPFLLCKSKAAVKTNSAAPDLLKFGHHYPAVKLASNTLAGLPLEELCLAFELFFKSRPILLGGVSVVARVALR